MIDREKANERARRWRAAHPEKSREATRKYQAAHPEKQRVRDARRDPEQRREQARQYRRADPERAREATRKYRKTHPEVIRAGKRRWSSENPEKIKNGRLRWMYGITLADYETYLAEQNGVCAICHEPPPLGQVLEVDHDHDSAAEWIRGLLCKRCNTAVGQYEHGKGLKPTHRLRALIAEYVEHHTEARSWER